MSSRGFVLKVYFQYVTAKKRFKNGCHKYHTKKLKEV